ncbi:MAG: hypothetical protein B5M48_01585 [Candidatus Omnitrophica bacterium 4484_213]|nr:MAG: hypothetical protein B5M48_01585 [Candidatus Omnitrophica bacterium 4484_213]
MKKVVLLLSIIFLLGIGQIALSAEVKIGYVDVEEVFNSHKKTEELNNKLQADQKETKKETEKRMKEIERLREESKLLSEKAKKKKEKVIEQKTKELQDFVLRTRQNLLEERNKMMKEILGDIDKVIQQKAKEGSYDLILDSHVLLYGSEGLDLTDEIIKALGK